MHVALATVAPSPLKIWIEMTALNALGGPLTACSFSALTGYFRDGCSVPPIAKNKHFRVTRVIEAVLNRKSVGPAR